MRQNNIQILQHGPLVFELKMPAWLCEDLYKIQAAQGVPLDILIRDLLEGFVADSWDFKTNSFRKTKWNSENKKPGLQSGRKRKNKLLLEVRYG